MRMSIPLHPDAIPGVALFAVENSRGKVFVQCYRRRKILGLVEWMSDRSTFFGEYGSLEEAIIDANMKEAGDIYYISDGSHSKYFQERPVDIIGRDEILNLKCIVRSLENCSPTWTRD